MNNKKEKIDGYITIDTSVKKDFDFAKMSVEEFIEHTRIDTSAFTQALQPIVSSIIKQIDISYITEQTRGITKAFGEIVQSYTKVFNDEFFKSITSFTSGFADILKRFEGIDKLDGHKVAILQKKQWVMPFEYPYEKINELDEITSTSNFEKLMIKHFSTRRVQRMFNEIIKNSRKDKKIITKQIKDNYFLGNYAICVTTLVTFLEGLSLEFLDINSDYQGNSHNVFKDILDYYNEQDISVKGYQEFLQIKMIADFYDDLFEGFVKLNKFNSKKSKRHPISHGAKYINRKIEVIRLANTILLLQKIIETTNLKEMFEGYKEKNDGNKVHFRIKQTNTQPKPFEVVKS